MSLIENLKEEIRQISTLEVISSAFTEVSSLKIGSIRNLFEKNKNFYEEISSLYSSVKLAAESKRIAKEKIKVKRKFAILSVAVTSNSRFYGRQNIEVAEKFINDVRKKDTECLVIGKLGSELLSSKRFEKPFESLIFERDIPSSKETHLFLDKIRDYYQVLLYYPKFITVFSQEVSVFDITHTPSESEVRQVEIDYIFEPELPKILEFFETQVRNTLFKRVMLETDLSRTAARLISMSAATDRARATLKEKRVELRRAYKSLKNTRLLETISGVRRWLSS